MPPGAGQYAVPRRRQPRPGRPPPQMADGQGERVRRVRGPGRVGKPQQPGHHARDLRLVGSAAAGDRRLDLARRVQRDRYAAPGRAQDGHRARLGRAHDRAHVVLAEHALDGDRVRPALGEPRLDLLFDGHEPDADLRMRGRADDRRADQPERVPGPPSTIPRPHRVSPGSTPRTRMAPPSAAPGLRANTCSAAYRRMRRGAGSRGGVSETGGMTRASGAGAGRGMAVMVRRRSHWAWGYDDELASEAELRATAELMSAVTGLELPGGLEAPVPLERVRLRQPRVAVPPRLAAICSQRPGDR